MSRSRLFCHKERLQRNANSLKRQQLVVINSTFRGKLRVKKYNKNAQGLTIKPGTCTAQYMFFSAIGHGFLYYN
ncbi:unnamed protein product [Clavelina lepadiformis]|uniref:Uncharacterized protein n=1 Tax=Clavelina lepadiformis TaxID=159417 RepID=A0ABP0F5U7_CLALP